MDVGDEARRAHVRTAGVCMQHTCNRQNQEKQKETCRERVESS